MRRGRLELLRQDVVNISINEILVKVQVIFQFNSVMKRKAKWKEEGCALWAALPACHSPFQLFQPVLPLKILLPPGLPLIEVLHLLDLVNISNKSLLRNALPK